MSCKVVVLFTQFYHAQDVMECQDYPVHNYTLVLKNPEGQRAVRTSQATGDVVSITIEGLKEDTLYTYCVTASNQFGTSKASDWMTVCEFIEPYLVAQQLVLLLMSL